MPIRSVRPDTRPSHRLTLKDRLSRLSIVQTEKLLGEHGKRLIQQGSKFDDIDLQRDVYFRGDLFRLTLRNAASDGTDVRVTLTLHGGRQQRLLWNCDCCQTTCVHVGAAFSLILDDKYSLGLSDIPKEGVPLERLSDDELVRRAVAERAKRGREERFQLRSSQPDQPWTDYVITSAGSGKSYRIALRGEERGVSYCSCPDFRTNTLGTCKHILYALDRVRVKFPAAERNKPFRKREFAVHLLYGDDITLWLQTPDKLAAEPARMVGRLADGPIDNLHRLLETVQRLEAANCPVTIYPDAEEWIQQRLHQECIAGMVQEIRQDPRRHPLRKELLKAELLPYQLDGIAFAVGNGRAILADDMGLGKTIQGIGVAELLARVADVRRVLIVCPASLKSQWRSEIGRFCDRDAQLVIGSSKERCAQYDNECFFTICNYEQVLRDVLPIERAQWDLIILDEGQRIKNWESKTSRVIKSLKSPFALVLSGTPLENRLDELYSVVQFIDDRRLGPGFRFFHRHRVVDERGKVIAYKNLDQLRERLRPILLRRTRESVLQQLPERNTEYVRIPASDEQSAMSLEQVSVAARIAAKKFLTEMDLLRIQKALLCARMAADSTFLVDKQPPGYSTKLEYLADFLPRLLSETGRKVVLFSEWTTMLNLIEPILHKHQLEFVRLDGSVPQKKRQQLVHRFLEDPDCRLFITTNAGSTGLNLQAANTVVNVDLPWNPAVLEQRIARAHRMGQQRPVDVYVLVSENTFEERLLGLLANKQELSLAVLDPESDVREVDFASGIDDLKRRLETLLGSKAVAPVDQSTRQRAEREVQQYGAHRERVAAAGGQLMSAVCNFLGELLPEPATPAPPAVVEQLREGLEACVEKDESGRKRLTLNLPDGQAFDQLVGVLARLLTFRGNTT